MVFGRKSVGRSNQFLAMAMIAGLAVGIGGCISKAPDSAKDGSSNSGTADDKVSKPATINVEGSSTVFLISQAMGNEFEKEFAKSKYHVSIGRSGTGGGYKKFVIRQCDLWNASRPIAEKEKAELKEKGIDWLELEVGIDGLSIAVHPKNDWCKEMTVGQLRKLWAPDSTITKWNELNPEWPDKPIELYGADTESGTFEYFTEVIVGKKGASRVKYSQNSDDNVLIDGVGGNEYSLGYIPYGYCVANKNKVKIIKISPAIAETDTAPAVEPTTETILSGEYKPLARPLYVYANKDALKRPEVVEFLKFTISEKAQPLVAKRGFVRMPEKLRQEMEARLEETLKGTATDKAK